MQTRKKLALAVTGALAALVTQQASAGIGFKAGNWDVDFSGNVNGFATWNSCDDSTTVVRGGLACNTGPGGNSNVNAVESGLLPSALVFSAKTRQSDLDIGVTIGFYPTIDTSAGSGSHNRALSNASINVRQNFLTFGDKTWGTVKVGRDIGIFGSDAILSDMTLLGVGSGAAFLGGPTTLGRIGVGYIYTDWIPQITYSTPSLEGFSAAVGVFQGLDIWSFAADPASIVNSATLSSHSQPGFQGKLAFEWKGDVGGKVWVSGMTQEVKANGNDNAPSGSTLRSNGFDVGGKITFGGFEVVGYYYDADGLGTTALGADGASFANGSLDKRKSKGYFGQGTFKIDKVKFGVSYGESKLDLAGNEDSTTNPDLVKKNKSWVGGVYYSLTEALTLVGEYIQTKAENQAGGEVKDSAFALGAILFF